jgi:hypothetical protein
VVNNVTYRPSSTESRIDFPGYHPEAMLQRLGAELKLESDLQIAQRLDVDPALISRVRRKRLPIGGVLLVRIHEITGWPTREIRLMYGDRRQVFRLREPGRSKPDGEGDGEAAAA